MQPILRESTTPCSIGTIRETKTTAPLQWLSKGWDDLLSTPLQSVAYGAFFALGGCILMWIGQSDVPFTITLTTGFLLAGPFLAVGLYELSRKREQGQIPLMRDALRAWGANPGPMAIFGLLIGLAVALWFPLSYAVFSLFLSAEAMGLRAFLGHLVTDTSGPAFIGTYAVIGGALGATVFATSAIALPMLLERRCTAFTALTTSVHAVILNWKAMTVWAGLILLFIGIGLATAFFGLALLMPLIGHATWHAYRDVIR